MGIDKNYYITLTTDMGTVYDRRKLAIVCSKRGYCLPIVCFTATLSFSRLYRKESWDRKCVSPWICSVVSLSLLHFFTPVEKIGEFLSKNMQRSVWQNALGEKLYQHYLRVSTIAIKPPTILYFPRHIKIRMPPPAKEIAIVILSFLQHEKLRIMYPSWSATTSVAVFSVSSENLVATPLTSWNVAF